MKLTDTVVAGLRCPEGRKDALVFDAATTGFGVRLQANRPPVFLFRYKLAGISRRIPLGAFGEITTAKARKEAERLRGLVLAGRDPWGERKREAAATIAAERQARVKAAADAFTVSALIDLYVKKHVATLRPATQRDVVSRLKLHLRPIGEQPAAVIGRAEAAKVVDRAAKAGETTARRVRDYARAMWRWARDRGTLSETAPNPWEAAPAPGNDRPRERVLSAEELGHVWRAAAKLSSPHGPMARFLLLTLARRDEVTAMTWGELSPDLATWTQPGTRTKNRKPHVVHLAGPARAILRELLGVREDELIPQLPKADCYVFALPGNKPITSHSWLKRQLDIGILQARVEASANAGAASPDAMPPWVLHDFRRSGVTWLAEAGFSPHVADRLLNHVQGTIKGVAAVYQRGAFLDERQRALEAWAAHIERCGAAAPTAGNIANLVNRRSRRA